MDKKLLLGIDIGGTKVKMGLYQDSQLITRHHFHTKVYSNPRDILSDINKWVQAQSLEVPLSSIGIGAPNVVNNSGKIIAPPNLNWGDIDLLSLAKDVWPGKTIHVIHDSLAMAYGEWLQENSPEVNTLYLTLGTGLGSCAIIQGQFISSMEAGHIVIVPEGRPCGCGGLGHLESYVGIQGIKTTYTEITGQECPPPRQLGEMAKQGDQQALECLRLTGSYLAHGIINCVALMPIERVVLTGGLSPLTIYMQETIEEMKKKLIFPPWRKSVQILRAPQISDDGAIFGAAHYSSRSV